MKKVSPGPQHGGHPRPDPPQGPLRDGLPRPEPAQDRAEHAKAAPLPLHQGLLPGGHPRFDPLQDPEHVQGVPPHSGHASLHARGNKGTSDTQN